MTWRFGLVAALAFGVAACSTLPQSMKPSGPVSRLDVGQGEARALISDYRRAKGLDGIEPDPELQRVAQRQAEAMASADLLSHEVAGSLPERLASAGLDRKAEIENVSAGYATLASVIEGWKRSPHHNENLLFRPMRRMGIAAATAPKTRFKTFWSLVMTN